jgi:RNA polymerase sigma-70 factor (ECF subfamily)
MKEAVPADVALMRLRSPAEIRDLRDGVLTILRRELVDHSQAEDLCNETFRIVLERLRQRPLEDPEGLAPYLAQTARFLVRGDRRTARRHRTYTGQQESIDQFEDPAGDPTVVAEAEARAKAVRELLREMPNMRDREILVRVYLRDQGKNEVCVALGIGDDHYRRVVFRARERFRELLKKRYRVSDLYCLALA